jgi:prepilin-type N-terminal cleavage/methylation domain-containing protein
MQNTRNENGFTLVELLVALIVSSIVLAAVATLAFAVGAAYDETDDTSQKQAQIRQATLRISELIRHCKLICGTPGGDLAIWRTDDNNDGQININELVYIERGPNGDHIRLYECDSVSNPAIKLSDIDSVGTSWWLGFYDSETYVKLLPQCSNVQFGFLYELPPQSTFVTISFDVVENDTARQYQISTALRGWAGNLLNDTGDNLVSGDDD